MIFGDIITKYRKRLGMTQEALANELGVTNQAVSKWESGQSCPDIALLPKIADLFGITIDQLFGREAAKQEGQPLPWADDETLRVVLYAGHKLVGSAHPTASEIHFCYEGPLLNVHSELSVSCGPVSGNVTAGGDVNCDDVYGSVESGGSVNCDEVYGSVRAEGSVTCDTVNGSVQASGDVCCDAVEGDVRAGGNVTCDSVDGDIHAGGDVQCDEAGGNITAGGSVQCDHWEQ